MISPRTRHRLLVLLLHGALGLWLVYSILPPVMLLAASFNSTALFRSPLDLLLLREFTTENFGEAFTRGAL